VKFDLQTIMDTFAAMPGWEVIAVILGLIYVIGAAKESAWCWVAGFFSTLIYTILFWEGQLLSSAMLNFYYMGMAIYGFIHWKRGSTTDEKLAITSWPYRKHILTVSSALLNAMILGFLLSTYTEARLPYLDASVTVFSVLATWMLAQKILENWLYWMFIDSAAITLYWSTGYYATIILFSVYVILSFLGYLSWRRSRNELGK